MNFKKRVNGSWHDTPHYVHNTSIDTLTTLPANIYPNATTATVGLKGNTVQSTTPTPQNPIMPSECGERTGNLFDMSTWNGVSAQRGTIKAVTNGFKLTATSDDCYSQTYASFAPLCSYAVKSGETYTLSWNVNNPNIYGAVFVFTGVSAASTVLTSVTASSKKVTFTIPSGHKHVAFRIGVAYSGDSLIYTDIMLNEGSTALPYKPYGYKLDISSGDTTTPVYLGEVETTRKIKKYEFTGQETISQGSENYYTSLPAPGVPYSNMYCTHNVYGACSVNNGGYIWLKISSWSDYATAEDLKAFFQQEYAAGTPVTVWYVLATPETGIVNEPLMRIGDYADEVSNISIPVTAGGDTISVDTTVQPSEVTINYKGWHPDIVHERTNGAWTE